ncbi:MAG TPA: hypothetical protein VFP65_22930 [Anaeromyxobacteraceae bacterium]|nr:hypothetical protein [Anaeromyxobacteraceae bacterium]
MTDTATTETTTTPPAPFPTLTDALRNPGQLVARRAEFVKAATSRAQHATAVARKRLQDAEKVAAARAQTLRSSGDALVATTLAKVRSGLSSGLVRGAEALQSLAKRIDEKPAAPAAKPE